MVKIDPEVLCDYCEDMFRTNRNHCEGNRCAETKEDFLQDKGITIPEARTFGNITINNYIYVIKVIHLIKVKPAKVSHEESKTEILFKDRDIHNCVVDNTKNSFIDSTGFHYYLRKEDAIEAYKKVMFNTIIKMTECLNTI